MKNNELGKDSTEILFSSVSYPIPSYWRQYLVSAYSHDSRSYHTLTHVQYMLDSLTQYKKYNGSSPLTDQECQILDLAILFHDCVYDPNNQQVGYNEIKSAEQFTLFADSTDTVYLYLTN